MITKYNQRTLNKFIRRKAKPRPFGYINGYRFKTGRGSLHKSKAGIKYNTLCRILYREF